MNPTSNSESFNTLTASSQSNLQDTLPLSQSVHDTSASNMQAQYQLPFQTSVTSAQISYENPILPVHPTSFFYRPSNDFCHYYISCKEIPYDTVGYLLNKSLK